MSGVGRGMGALDGGLSSPVHLMKYVIWMLLWSLKIEDVAKKLKIYSAASGTGSRREGAAKAWASDPPTLNEKEGNVRPTFVSWFMT